MIRTTHSWVRAHRYWRSRTALVAIGCALALFARAPSAFAGPSPAASTSDAVPGSVLLGIGAHALADGALAVRGDVRVSRSVTVGMDASGGSYVRAPFARVSQYTLGTSGSWWVFGTPARGAAVRIGLSGVRREGVEPDARVTSLATAAPPEETAVGWGLRTAAALALRGQFGFLSAEVSGGVTYESLWTSVSSGVQTLRNHHGRVFPTIQIWLGGWL